jgi:hypothetical protein
MPFTLEQFGEVLQARNPAGKPYVIIGGQAVNYWATRSLPQEAGLAAWQPFASKDIDFRGNRDDVLQMAAQLGRPAVFPHKKMMTAFAGGVPWSIGDARSRVEFVRQIPGSTPEAVEKLAVEHDYLGQPVRVIDPISLLACKLVLALTVEQRTRRDADHARILLLCVRAFLRDTLRGVESGELPTRGWLGAAERLLKMAESKTGRQAALKLKVHWPQALPEAEIAASKTPLIARFREKRLTQWRVKVQQSPRRK